MTLPWPNASHYKVLAGDCRKSMMVLPDKSVHCCVTSPPYFGLRDYQVDGQLGLEATPDEYVESLVSVFREVWRVLRDDGSLWLNLGDSYAASSCQGGTKGFNGKPKRLANKPPEKHAIPPGLKPKDIIGIPWQAAFALRADGWYLRQEIIWQKTNPMPESVKDRCTKAHEQIFLLTKSPKYYYDHEAIMEPSKASTLARDKYTRITKGKDGPYAVHHDHETPSNPKGRNKRSVWTVSTKSYKGAHCAVFPPDLILPCILAGCPEGGTVLDPFGGSGTTAGVAVAHGRNAILCELNPEYIESVPKRVEGVKRFFERTR